MERENNLLTFLLINGYIDENYEEYINYFYSGALKTNDKAFIISIKSQKRLRYDYELKEIKEVIENLPHKYFKQKEILNFNLLDFMLENHTKYIEKLELVFELLADEAEEIVEFCTKFMQKTKNIELFVQRLCNNWVSIWKYISENCSDEIKRMYAYNILKYATFTSIKDINDIKSINEYIALEQNFIKNFNGEIEIEKIKQVITNLNVKFENIDINDIDTELGKFIVTNNFYKINKHMVYAVLEKIYKYEVNVIKSKNYTSILKTQDSQFIQYINENIVEYVKNVYLLGEELSDSIEDITNIINIKEISIENKENIINRQTTIIHDISTVNAEVWDILLKNNKLLENWDNIITYYQDKNITTELIDYINYNFTKLSEQEIDCGKKYEKEVYDDFYQEIVSEEKVNKDIIKCLECVLPVEILEQKLSNNRIKAIIQQGKLIIDESAYNLIRVNYNDLIIVFIENNIEFFIENQNDLEYKEEIKQILMSDNITNEYKLCIINNLSSDMGCNDEELAYKYYSLIIDSNEKVKVSLNLLKDIIDLIIEEKGIRLLINQAENLTEEDIVTILDDFTYPYNAITSKQIPKLVKNELNEKFVTMLKLKRISCISSIREKGDTYIVYKKRE